MPTYSLSARNQFRSPSGAVGEAPDGPGGIAALRDDVENFIGVGGAEYCANVTALNAIPSSRRFIGKRAYQADIDTEYRWDGSGWRGWNSGWVNFTPSIVGFTVGNGSWDVARYRYVDGLVYAVMAFTGGTTSTPTGVPIITLPVNGSDTYGVFTGQFKIGGAYWTMYAHHSATNQVRLRTHTVVGTAIRLDDASTTIPAAWSTGSQFEVHCLYRA